MRKPALDQARERLGRAAEAVRRMQNAKAYSYKDENRAWSDFLLAASGVYSKLEQGAKGCGTSEGWFGRKKHDRKKDELLNFIHHARNTDEHGISGTTLFRSNVTTLEGRLDSVGVNIMPDGSPQVVVSGQPGSRAGVEMFTGLKMVKDSRHGDSFMPPTQHLGQPLEADPSVVLVAELGLAYLEGLVAEAAKLPERP
jgi:hypothetical protein